MKSHKSFMKKDNFLENYTFFKSLFSDKLKVVIIS